MSSFIRRTKNPETGVFEDACWLDDCFGPHRYGVQFPDGRTYSAEGRAWEFEDIAEEPPR